jgi:ComF family protein
MPAAATPGMDASAEPPPQAFSALMAPFFCPACRDDFPGVSTPACSHCGKAITAPGRIDSICDACRLRPKHFDKARAFGIYDGSLKTALHALKYRSKTQLAAPLGTLLFGTFARHWPGDDIDFIVPVPLHRRKFRRRGFNQAFLLIRKWPKLARKRGMPFGREMLQRSMLNRTRDTSAQVGMNRSVRHANMRNAVVFAGGPDIAGKQILLVDDVFTTGATADECARALRHAGASRVDILTLAQTVQTRS